MNIGILCSTLAIGQAPALAAAAGDPDRPGADRADGARPRRPRPEWRGRWSRPR